MWVTKCLHKRHVELHSNHISLRLINEDILFLKGLTVIWLNIIDSHAVCAQ